MLSLWLAVTRPGCTFHRCKKGLCVYTLECVFSEPRTRPAIHTKLHTGTILHILYLFLRFRVKLSEIAISMENVHKIVHVKETKDAGRRQSYTTSSSCIKPLELYVYSSMMYLGSNLPTIHEEAARIVTCTTITSRAK